MWSRINAGELNKEAVAENSKTKRLA